jgi:O-succinylbenzoic acid--CoA ligase
MYNLVALEINEPKELANQILTAWENSDAPLILDPRLPKKLREKIITNLRPHLYIKQNQEPIKLPGGIPVSENDALIIPTSGTTGDPKGVILTHQAIKSSVKLTHKYLNFDPVSDKWLLILPPYHIGGLMVILRSLLCNTSFEALEQVSENSLNTKLIQGYNLTAAVGSQINFFRELEFKAVLFGAMPTETKNQPNFIQTYGLTETCSGVVYNGVCLEGVTTKIEPETGQIFLKSPTLLRAYRNNLNNPLAVTPEGWDPKTTDGFFPTKDVGFINQFGKLEVLGRIDDVIITGGEKVWPQKVETTLKSLPGVKDVALTGLPHPKWGSIVCALIVYKDQRYKYSYQDLKALLLNELAFYEIPKLITSVPELPKTPLGKLKRKEVNNLAKKMFNT